MHEAAKRAGAAAIRRWRMDSDRDDVRRLLDRWANPSPARRLDRVCARRAGS
jgi:hypothetical protein